MTAGIVTRGFTPTIPDDVPVAGELLRRVEVELAGIITVDVDVTVGTRTERRTAREGDGRSDRHRGGLAERQDVPADTHDGGTGRDTGASDGGTNRDIGHGSDRQRGGGRAGGAVGRRSRAEVDALAADVSVTRVGIIGEDAEDDTVLTDAEAFVTAVGDVGGAAGAIAEDGIDRKVIAAGEDDKFASDARDNGAARDVG